MADRTRDAFALLCINTLGVLFKWMFVDENSIPRPVPYFQLEIILQIRFFYNSQTYNQSAHFVSSSDKLTTFSEIFHYSRIIIYVFIVKTYSDEIEG